MKSSRKQQQHIFFVDDEPNVRWIVAKTLEQLGAKVTCFDRAADCLEQLRSHKCDLLITDVRMSGMDGLKLLTEVKHIIPYLPVLVITGYGDVPMAVKALKAGAVDFIEKPLERYYFLSAVESALSRNIQATPPVAKLLTKAEIKVLQLILDGKNNKEIAQLLHRSVRTVEDHRNHIMSKLGVDNLVELVKQVAVVRLPEFSENE